MTPDVSRKPAILCDVSMSRSHDVTTRSDVVDSTKTTQWRNVGGTRAHGVITKADDVTGSPVWRGREFVCGYGAAVINVTATFPLNKVMFRQQLHGIRMWRAVRQLQHEGFLHLYRGLTPPLLQKSTSMAIMFGMYDMYQCLIWTYIPQSPMFITQATAAILAGCTEAILCPFERVQTLMQNKYYHDHFRNTYHAFIELRANGISEYYRGLTPILLRNGSSNAMFFMLRGPLKDLFIFDNTSRAAEMSANFVSGAILGASISTLFYPLNVVKVRMQEHVGGPYTGMRESFHSVFNERNRSWRKMFRGAQVNFTRSLVSWGIINTSYELLKSVLYADSYY